MADPDFSESQLQSAVNSALVRHALGTYGVWLLPHVVSLVAEFEAGWDSAFLAPWFPAGDPDQDGCNLFIQYKLSEKLVSSGAGQWKHWSKAYYRFRIPHRTLDANEQYVDDYHQWQSLRKIAKAGHATFYATNCTLRKANIEAHYKAGDLLDQVAWLDVSDVKKKHENVTFTEGSTFFYLHSEPEEVEKTRIGERLPAMAERYEQLPIRASNQALIELLRTILGEDAIGHEELEEVQRLASSPIGRRYPQYIHGLIRSLIHRQIGVALIWVPRLVG